MVEDFFRLRKEHFGESSFVCRNACEYADLMLIYPLGQIVNRDFTSQTEYKMSALLCFIGSYFCELSIGSNAELWEDEGTEFEFMSDFILLYPEYKKQIFNKIEYEDSQEAKTEIEQYVTKKFKNRFVEVGDILYKKGLPKLVVAIILMHGSGCLFDTFDILRLLESRMGADENPRFKDAQ